ncbi:MAG TPA: T9SS type A sorting domain-containing protein [Vicingaceae bacterium]|nr:T9SS type A sorting domain-containing protein [Vicingaceae bacterium]
MRHLLTSILIIYAVMSFAQKDTIAHLYAVGGAGIDKAESIVATSDGAYVVVGSTTSNTSGNTDVYLLKLDSQINVVWSWAIGGNNNDWGYKVKETFDKGFIIVATSNSFSSGGDYDARLIKTDSLGVIQWQKSYGGNDWDLAYDVIQTTDSGFAFCGETYNNTNGESDVYIVKTNLLGDTLWTRTIGGSLVDKGNSIIETTDSNLVIAGMTTTTTDSVQMYMIKLTGSGGLIWNNAYGTTAYEEAHVIIEAANGDYVLGGVTTGFTPNNDKDFYMIRADSIGNTIWGNFFGQVGEEVIYDMVELANGSFFSTGHTTAAGNGGKDALVFLITSGGFWGNSASTFGGTKDEESKSILLEPNEALKIAGFTKSYGNGLEDVMIIEIDTVVTNHQFTVDTINDFMPLKIDDLTSWKPASEENILIFPNPASSVVNIDVSNSKATKIMVFSVFGELVYESSIYNQEITTINLSNLSSGIYSVQFFENNKMIASQKLILTPH